MIAPLSFLRILPAGPLQSEPGVQAGSALQLRQSPDQPPSPREHEVLPEGPLLSER